MSRSPVRRDDGGKACFERAAGTWADDLRNPVLLSGGGASEVPHEEQLRPSLEFTVPHLGHITPAGISRLESTT